MIMKHGSSTVLASSHSFFFPELLPSPIIYLSTSKLTCGLFPSHAPKTRPIITVNPRLQSEQLSVSDGYLSCPSARDISNCSIPTVLYVRTLQIPNIWDTPPTRINTLNFC